MFETLILIFGLATVVVFLLAIGVWLMDRRRRLEAEALAPTTPPANAGVGMILGDFTPALADQFPVRGPRVAEIQHELREAGFYSRHALVEYQAVRTALILLPLVVGGSFTALASREQIPAFAVATLIATGIGASVPRFYITTRAKMRARQIESGLTIALDLINLGLSAGQTIFAALAGVSRKIRKAYPVLAKELEIVREQAEIGNLAIALQHFADRTNVPDVRNLASVLVQSDRLGTDISGGLIEFSSNLRANLRHRAEAQANRANFWMLIPTIGCLWLAAALMLVLPIYHDFLEKRVQIRENRTSGSQKVLDLKKKAAVED
jgi:tight adherence protein C